MKTKLNYYLFIAFCAMSVFFQSCDKSDEVEPQNNSDCVLDCNEQIIEDSQIKVEMPDVKAEKQTISLIWPAVEGATHYQLYITKDNSANGREETFETKFTTTKTNIQDIEVPCGKVHVAITPFKGDEKLNKDMEKFVVIDCPEKVDVIPEGGKDWSDAEEKYEFFGEGFFLNDEEFIIPIFLGTHFEVPINAGVKNYLRVPITDEIEEFKEDYFVISDAKGEKENLKLHVKGIEGPDDYLVMYFIPEANSKYILTISKEYANLILPDFLKEGVAKVDKENGELQLLLVSGDLQVLDEGTVEEETVDEETTVEETVVDYKGTTAIEEENFEEADTVSEVDSFTDLSEGIGEENEEVDVVPVEEPDTEVVPVVEEEERYKGDPVFEYEDEESEETTDTPIISVVDENYGSALDIETYYVKEASPDLDNKLRIIINKPHNASIEVRYVIVEEGESGDRPVSEFEKTVYYTEYAPGEVNSKSDEPLFVTSNPDQKDFVIQARVYDVANKTWGPVRTFSVTLY